VLHAQKPNSSLAIAPITCTAASRLPELRLARWPVNHRELPQQNNSQVASCDSLSTRSLFLNMYSVTLV
jgi:hypothetical protein